MRSHVLCIDDDKKFLASIKVLLSNNLEVSTAENFKVGRQLLRESDVDLVFLDLDLGGSSGLDVLTNIKKEFPRVPVVMLSGHKKLKDVVKAIKRGADDYLAKDASFDELEGCIIKAIKSKNMQDKCASLIRGYTSHTDRKDFIGSAPCFKEIISHASKLKGFGANILIEGETGTGKELLATFINANENQTARPYIDINCAAIPDGLLESELFGHEKGAFSGATEKMIGKMELADGGDLILDEICSMDPRLQAKMLRAVQEKVIYRVGGNRPIKINVRLISISNHDLGSMVNLGKFRKDLYHRLKVVSLVMPSLRERKGDIPELASFFLKRYGRNNPKRLTKQALQVLQEYSWPGNVRELENVIQGMIINVASDVIGVENLPRHILGLPTTVAGDEDNKETARYRGSFFVDPQIPLLMFRKEAEKNYIKWVIDRHAGNKTAAARTLKISRVTLHQMIKEGGLQ
ncbi:MAG: sigma-54-dependent Fis family transcriptional regulator [Deltaproteobacteria bacterium]|nr:sigma-54-dependent Fis family transcriptional regulator [Deltaproteobacteria bacterium]